MIGYSSGSSKKSIIGLLFILLSILSMLFINEIVGIVIAAIAFIIGIFNLKEKIFMSFVIMIGSLILIIYFILILATGSTIDTNTNDNTSVNGSKNATAKIMVLNYAKEMESNYYLAILNGNFESLDSLVMENYGSDVTCEKKILTENSQIELENCIVKGYLGSYNYKNGIVE